MTHPLTRDEFDALDQVKKAKKDAKPSACIARNARHLIGSKMISLKKDGNYVLTEKGAEALFVKQCITGLQQMAAKADTVLDAPVQNFLGRKGYIVEGAEGQFTVTARGQECLTDIAKNG